MQTFLFIVSILVFALGVLLIYNLLKPLVFEKIKVNKWLILALAIIEFVVPVLVWPTMPVIVEKYVIPGVFVLLFLWFMDLSGYIKKAQPASTSQYKKKKKDNIVIRPKAKPNRVKK